MREYIFFINLSFCELLSATMFISCFYFFELFLINFQRLYLLHQELQ